MQSVITKLVCPSVLVRNGFFTLLVLRCNILFLCLKYIYGVFSWRSSWSTRSATSVMHPASPRPATISFSCRCRPSTIWCKTTVQFLLFILDDRCRVLFAADGGSAHLAPALPCHVGAGECLWRGQSPRRVQPRVTSWSGERCTHTDAVMTCNCFMSLTVFKALLTNTVVCLVCLN